MKMFTTIGAAVVAITVMVALGAAMTLWQALALGLDIGTVAVTLLTARSQQP